MYFIVFLRPKHIYAQIHTHNNEDCLLTKGISFPNIIKAGKLSFILSLWSWKGKHWKQVFSFLGIQTLKMDHSTFPVSFKIALKLFSKTITTRCHHPYLFGCLHKPDCVFWPKRKSGLIQFRIIKIPHKKSTLPNVHNVSNSTTSYCPLYVYVNYSIDFHWGSRKEHLMGRKDMILRSFSSW